MPPPVPIQESWSKVSRKFVRYQELPRGTKLVLEHKPNGTRRRPRKVRADRMMTRQRFSGLADDNATLTSMFEDYLHAALVEKLDTRRFAVKLVGPNGETSSGLTRVKTVRAWPPKPTRDELEEAQAKQAEVEEIAAGVVGQINQDEHMRDYDQVRDGYALGLVQRYGVSEALEAVRMAAQAAR